MLRIVRVPAACSTEAATTLTQGGCAAQGEIQTRYRRVPRAPPDQRSRRRHEQQDPPPQSPRLRLPL